MANYASPVAAALRKPIIPIMPAIPHDAYDKVILYNSVNEGTAAHPIIAKKREEVFFCDKADVEYIIRTIREFEDATEDTRLHVGDWTKQFGLFRKCLGGTVREHWDGAKDGKAEDDIGWRDALKDFLKEYIEDTDLAAQKMYMDNTKKPWNMTVKALGDRLLEINALLSYFPGANNTAPFLITDLKYKLVLMSPTNWQIKFAETGKQLSDATYEYKDLIRFLTIQEQLDGRNRPTGGYQGGTPRQGGHRGRDNNYDTNPRQQSRRRFTYLPQFPCPYHDRHLWRDCFGNPDGPKYKPSYILPSSYPYQNRTQGPRNDAPPPPRRDERGPPRGNDRGPPRGNDQGNNRYPPARRNLGAAFGQQNYRGNNRDDRYRTPGNNNYQRGRRQDQHMHDDQYQNDRHVHYESSEQPYDDRYYDNDQVQDQQYHDDRLRQDHYDSRSQRHDPSSNQDQDQDQDTHWMNNIQF